MTPVKETTSSLNAVTAYGNTVYVCGNGGTILKSTDGGRNWQNIVINIEGIPSSSINFTDIYTTNGNIVWVCGNYNSPTEPHTGAYFFVSSDGGTTWEGRDFLNTETYYIAHNESIVARDVNNVWIAGPSRILFSSNKGNTWNEQTVVPNSRSIYDFSLAGENTIYAGVSDGSLLKGTNGGSSWNHITNISGLASIEGVSTIDENKVWICGLYNGSSTVKYTDNGGNSWYSTSIETSTSGISAYDNNIFTVYLFSLTVLYTHDSGQNWTLDTYNVTGGFNDIQALSNQSAVAVGHTTNEGGVIFLVDASQPPSPGPTPPGPTPSPARSSGQLIKTGPNDYSLIYLFSLIFFVLFSFKYFKNIILNFFKI